MAKHPLTDEEIQIILSLLSDKYQLTNQEIVGLINRVRGDTQKHVNSGRISEIKSNFEGRYTDYSPASDEITRSFLEKARDLVHAPNPLSSETIALLLPFKEGSNTHFDILETDQIECKRSINFVMKTIAAFANNKGGYFIFGVEDGTWEIIGIQEKKLKSFDFNKLNTKIRSTLGMEIKIDAQKKKIDGKTIAIFYVHKAHTRPVIMQSSGSDGIAIGQIYYRYIGEDRLISPIDLQKIINERIHEEADTVLKKHLNKILSVGIENAAIMNLATGEVEGKSGNFFIDEEILTDLKFVKEGEFVETAGAPTLKLIGELKGTVTNEKHVLEDIHARYPLSWKSLWQEVRKLRPHIKQNQFIRAINDLNIKKDEELSHYVFRNKAQQDTYERSGKVAKSTTSIYSNSAINVIIAYFDKL